MDFKVHGQALLFKVIVTPYLYAGSLRRRIELDAGNCCENIDADRFPHHPSAAQSGP
jgi:hypothetical protein